MREEQYDKLTPVIKRTSFIFFVRFVWLHESPSVCVCVPSGITSALFRDDELGALKLVYRKF